MSRTPTRWALAALLLGGAALAAPPAEFTVQGVLRDGSGVLQSASVNVTVTLFDAATGGTKLAGPYSLTNIAVTSGLFTATVTDPGLPAIVSAASAVWVELLVGNDTFPRQKVTTAMFAASAIDSQKLGGADAGAYQRRLATPDCGVGKHLQGVAADGTATCVADPAADGTSLKAAGGVFSVAYAGTGTAATAARSDHTHTATMSCVQRAGVANVAGGGYSYAACNAGETLTGGGCSSTLAAVKTNAMYACRGILCLCLVGQYCPPDPSWQCGSFSNTDTSITAFAVCCTTTVQ